MASMFPDRRAGTALVGTTFLSVILTDKDGAKREGNGRELYAKGA
jgi:hypothetical protein